MTKTQARLLESLKQEMRSEIDMLAEFVRLEESLGGMVTRRDWPSMEEALATLNEMSVRIETTEGRRHEVYTDLKETLSNGDEASFRDVLSSLPASETNTLRELQTEMRSTLVRVKSLSNGLIYYLSCMRESTSRILEEVFPQRKGKIYSSSGRTRDNLEQPRLVNQRL